MKLVKLILIALAFCLTSYGSQVVSVHPSGTAVAITHGVNEKWLADDELCVHTGDNAVSCGVVTRTTENGAILTFDESVSGISVGNSVRLASVPETGGSVSDVGMTFSNHDRDEEAYLIPAWDFSLGFLWFTKDADSHQFIPELQAIVGGNMTLGFFGSIGNSNDGTTFFTQIGAGAGFHYYTTHPYRGLWVNASYSREFVTLETQYTSVTTQFNLVRGSLGWRWKGENIDGGTAIGFGPVISFGSGQTTVGFMVRAHIGAGFSMSEIFH